MILFLYGPDSYRRKARVDVLKKAFQDKFDAAGHNIAHIDGADFHINTFHTHTKSGGLFSTKRFLLFTNIWALGKDDQTALLEALTATDDDTIVCISADSPPRKDNKLYKALLQNKTVEEYGDLDHSKLRAFIESECAKRGASIDSQALAALIAGIGNDLWRMTSEINKLANYTKAITKETTDLFLDASLNDNIFDLTDALGARNAKRALTLLDEQFLLGSNAQYLITMLGKHIHNLLLVKEANGEKLSLHPYIVQKATAQCKQFEGDTLRQLHTQLLHIDHQLKSKKIDPQVLLDQFVVAACN